ncbi:hypothetical protein DWB85_00590 [Seongchinamella sediminis]|uniref:Type II secretion system protein GspC N-terminal domain-containing protein n=1 Tax=Seongchinamella sediminis TaxID=2283635 RepID=A0A3L7E1H5_9GAMM|nr:hypothetical protein [Seongchinamella sediminis]RLQ23688.1 hypothetical protein DWB85_00590 [Seongchinamella sediminis]
MNLVDRYRNLEDPTRAERRVELALVLVLLLLALQLLWGGFRALFPALPEPVQPRPDSLQVSELVVGVEVDPGLRAEIAARPLFWPSRRPPEPEVEALAEAQPEAEAEAGKPGKIDGIQLTGIFGGGESAGIIVINKGKKRRLMVGEKINGWELASVQPSEALFINGDRKTALVLKQAVIQAAPAVSPAAAAAQAAADDRAGKPKKASAKQRETSQPEDSGSLTLGGRARPNQT